jgi:hypothetical protein
LGKVSTIWASPTKGRNSKPIRNRKKILDLLLFTAFIAGEKLGSFCFSDGLKGFSVEYAA